MVLMLLGFLLYSIPDGMDAAEQHRSVLILKSGNAAVYNHVVTHIRRHFDRQCAESAMFCGRLTIQSFITNEAKPTYQHYDLVITLGSKAKRYALRNLPESKTINAMIPSGLSLLTHISSPPAERPTILLDQPFERSLRLIKRVTPQASDVGLMLSRRDRELLDELARMAATFGLTLHAEVVDSERDIGRKLALLLDEIDVLLAQPDINIYNRKTVSQILLSSYRKRIPVIGYSAAYVKAGAFAAVFSSPTDIARQIADAITLFLTDGALPTGRFPPSYFSVSINQQVGHSLGIQWDADPDQIARFIKDGER
jgi:ABC-type uncharacterized transport system substrate-binding protein